GRSTTGIPGRTIPNGRIEAFTDPTFTEPGYWGQGKDFSESLNDSLTANGAGEFTILLSSLGEGLVAATVTDADGNTSAFTPIIDAKVIQTIESDPPMLVLNKPTIVRMFVDAGTHRR